MVHEMANEGSIDWRRVSWLLTDVDGVLTDGRIYAADQGGFCKAFSTKDGLAIKRWIDAGIGMVWISGHASLGVERRARELGVSHLFQGVDDKRSLAERFFFDHRIDPADVAYVGDDLSDLPVMRIVGLPIAVADAVEELLPAARYITAKIGGQGAIREVVERVMRAKGIWSV